MAGGLNILSVRGVAKNRVAYQPTGISENIAANLMAVGYSAPGALPAFHEASDLYDRRNKLNDRFGSDYISKIIPEEPEPTLYDTFFRSGTSRMRESRMRENEAIDAAIMKGRAENPSQWEDIQTTEEMRSEMRRKARFTAEEAAYVSSRASGPVAKYGGMIIGSIAGAFTDPINVVTLPLGAVSGMRTLTAIGAEALANAAIETVQTPSYIAWQKELGNKVTIGQAIGNIATAGLAAGAFTGVLRGAAPLAETIGRKTLPVLQAIGDNKTLPTKVRDAAKYVARVKHLDEEIPFELIQTMRTAGKSDIAANAIHRGNLERTLKALEDNVSGVRYYDEIPFDLAERNIKQAPPSTFNLGELDGARYRNYTPPTEQDVRWLDGLNKEVQEFRTGERVFIERDGQGGTADVVGVKSESPQWFKDVGATRAEVEKVTQKLKDGAPLGKREAVVADAMMREVKSLREENIKQYQAVKDARRLEDELSIDAVTEREAAGMEDIDNPAYRPSSDAAEYMRNITDAGDVEQLREVYRADFDRLADEETLQIGKESYSLADIRKQLEDDQASLDAIRTCALGG